MSIHPPIVLCFSGSDPSGGAGIQADIATVHNLGAHCASVITALTIQNTANVLNFFPTPPEILIQQAEALVADMAISAIKIGMLGSLENVVAISQWLKKHPTIPVILDPVTAASGGGHLAKQPIVDTMLEQLFPLVTLVTPNSLEARQLAPQATTLAICAKDLIAHGCQNVLIKGSHENTPDVSNMLYNRTGLVCQYAWPRLPHSYHGSGCTLAASIGTLIAMGMSLEEALVAAQRYTWHCLANAYQPGQAQYIPQRWYWGQLDYLSLKS